MFLGFLDGIWCYLRLMGTELCQRVFLSLIQLKLSMVNGKRLSFTAKGFGEILGIPS